MRKVENKSTAVAHGPGVARCVYVSFIMPRKPKVEKWEEETTSLTDKSIFVTQVEEGEKGKVRKLSYKTSDSDQMNETGPGKEGKERKKSDREKYSKQEADEKSFSLPLSNHENKKIYIFMLSPRINFSSPCSARVSVFTGLRMWKCV